MSSGRHWGSSTAVEGPWRDVDGPGGWDRLVLPSKLIKQLKAVPARYVEHVRLSPGSEPGPGEWLIFEAPSGSGTSSAAQTLANQLRLPLLATDAASWTGSLDELFAPVAGHFAVLLVDHADAVLSAGPSVAQALSQLRLQLTSVVIFRVGSRRGLPVAVLENFDRILTFPEPDAAARREIWRRALPPDAAVPDKAIAGFAQEFTLTGKEIVSCVVAAESWSLEHHVPLSPELLADVAKEKFPGRGRSAAPKRVRARLDSPRLAALGVALARHSPPSQPLALDRQAAVGAARFSYPSQWVKASTSMTGLAPAVSLTSSAGQLVLGMSRTAGGTGIPAAAAGNLDATPEMVALGANRFYRVLALGRAQEDVYALPAAQGTVVGICKTASSAFAQSCERVLATVALAPVSGPGSAALTYTRALSLILTTLNRTRTHLSTQLAQAANASSQSQALQGLASAHGTVAREVAALPSDGAGAANRALAAALSQAAGAYAGLAQAAQRKDAGAYRAGQLAVSRAEAAIRAALAELSARGYRIV